MSILNIDFNLVFEAIKKAFYSIIKIPFGLLNKISYPIKITITICLIGLSIYLLIKAYKNKNEWLSVRF